MNQPLLTFQRFNDIGLATEFAEKLTELGIYCEIDNQTVPFDVTYANNPLQEDVRIKVKPEDFDRANAALDDYYKSQLDNIDKDYYLFTFTHRELMEIVRKPDEWNRLDYQLALKLLKERGLEVQPEETQKLQTDRIAELTKSEKAPLLWIIGGYGAAVAVFVTDPNKLSGLYAMSLPIVGIIVGALFIFSKKTIPNGSQVYTYTKKERGHGKAILVLSIAGLIFRYVITMGLVFNH